MVFARKFSPRKNQKVEFFTQVKGLADLAPPVPAGKLVPGWFRQAPEARENHQWANQKLRGVNKSVSHCPGIRDYLLSGWVIPLWCDYHIDVDRDGGVNWLAPDGTFKLGSHPAEQLQGMPQKFPYPAIKFINPWFIKTPPGYSTLFLPPVYQVEPGITILPGIVDTDTYHNAHLPALLNIAPGESLMLERGMPVVHVIPFRREKLDFDSREATAEDERIIASFQLGVRTTFDSNYQKIRQKARRAAPDEEKQQAE